MFRFWPSILSSAVIALAFHSARADLDPQANGLPGGMIIRQQAKDFDAMVRQVKPDFVWNGTDMLWITHGKSGNLGFSMDRAYTVEFTGQRINACCLFDCDGYALGNEGCDGPAYPFTHESDAAPVEVAQDPKWGEIYQTRWRSVGDLGSGCNRYTRNIFLLCDRARRWHLLGDGPVANSYQEGASDNTVDNVVADVRWTGDAAHPVALSFTLLSTYEWERDLETSFSMTVRHKMVPMPEGTPFNAFNGGSFKPQGHYYVIADKSEPLSAFAQKVAHCGGLDYRDELPNERQKEIYRAMETALKQIDSSLAGGITAGANIVLPDKLYGSHYGDINEW